MGLIVGGGGGYSAYLSPGCLGAWVLGDKF